MGTDADALVIAGRRFSSRLFLGVPRPTGKEGPEIRVYRVKD